MNALIDSGSYPTRFVSKIASSMVESRLSEDAESDSVLQESGQEESGTS